MNRSIVITIVVVLLVAAALFVIVKNPFSGNGNLVTPGVKKMLGQPAPEPIPTPISTPQTPVYNPPPEAIEYDNSTDLKQELESVNPEVLESDFE